MWGLQAERARAGAAPAGKCLPNQEAFSLTIFFLISFKNFSRKAIRASRWWRTPQQQHVLPSATSGAWGGSVTPTHPMAAAGLLGTCHNRSHMQLALLPAQRVSRGARAA